MSMISSTDQEARSSDSEAEDKHIQHEASPMEEDTEGGDTEEDDEDGDIKISRSKGIASDVAVIKCKPNNGIPRIG